jgi:hypothetical protein
MIQPETIEATRLPRHLLEDLALKILCLEGEISLADLSRRMEVSYSIAETLFQRLRAEHLCQVKGMDGPVHRITPTSEGRNRALELLRLGQYAGPAPVSLDDYVACVRAQSVRDAIVSPPSVHKALDHLVLSAEMVTRLGTAAVSGRSIFLYGPPGTGKTAIAEALPDIYADTVWIPYAVEVGGQIISVYDPNAHRSVPTQQDHHDGRWMRCQRPRVIAGGELTLEMLDLQMDPATRLFGAPLHMRANNGVLVIDDFGRQRVRPEELLNRWIIPLERRIDFLTLPGGRKFEIPFELFVVFATNLDPKALADGAFLRRIPTKMKLDYVAPPQFQEIFRRACQEFQLSYTDEVVDYIIAGLAEINEPLRASHPKDIIHQVLWSARYQSKPPQLDIPSVREALAMIFPAESELPAELLFSK